MEKIIGDLENDARVLADQHKLLKLPAPKKTPKKLSNNNSEAKTSAQPVAKKKTSTTSNNLKNVPKKKLPNNSR